MDIISRTFFGPKNLESHVMNASTKHISIIETNTNTEVSLETALNEKNMGGSYLKAQTAAENPPCALN